MDNELITYHDERDTPFELGNRVGTGPHVVVRMAKKRDSTKWSYAQKTITLDGDTVESVKRAFIQEVKILRHAQHHHVIAFVDAFAIEGEAPSLAVVMNRASGSIQDFLTGKRRKNSDLDQMKQWFGCLASVLDYIHGIGIRHRDIKPANILYHEKTVRLADFGISQMGLGQTLSTTIPEWARGRTAQYCAPEVEQGGSRGRSADVFSLGAVFLEMLVAHSYLDQLHGLRKKLMLGEGGSYAKRVSELHGWMQNFENDIKRIPEDDWRRQVLSISQRMLHEDRDERPSASQLKEYLPPCTCCSLGSMTREARLVEACKVGDKESVELLVESGTSPGTIGAIHQASARGYEDIVQYLLDSQADINLRDHSNQTALHCAAGNKQEVIVDLLLSRRATVAIQDTEGRTPLHYASGSGNTNIVSKLLDRSKAQVDIKDQNGQTAFHFAAKRGHRGAVQRLLVDADPSISDTRGRTALHFAAGYGSEDVIETLLKRVDFNIKDTDESTALHFAAKGKRLGGNYEEAIKMLLQGGADPLREDLNCMKPIWYATKNKTPGRRVLRDATRKAAEPQQMESSPEGSPEGSEAAARASQEGPTPKPNILDEFHPDLISFITIAQYHKVDIWPFSWDPSLDMLGKGATGDVMQFTVNLEAQFAFKRFVSHRANQPKDVSPDFANTVFKTNDRLFKALISELVILSQPEIRRHPHIVDIEGIAFDVESTTPDSSEVWPVLVMKKAHHGSLQRYMQTESGKAMDFPTRLQVCAQIGSAISTMHSNEIVHGDVKPANVLAYADEGSVRAQVTDFSYSCFGKNEEDTVHVPKTEPWKAPEHRGSKVKIRDAKLMDIYSFGMVCLWLLYPEGFHELVDIRRGHLGNENGQWSIQSVVERLASEESSLSPSSRQNLVTFFNSTLCETPEERRSDLKGLIELLGQTAWQPNPEQGLFDGTRRLTLADYGATKDDIDDPVKLQALTQNILNSLRLTGTDYDSMREHLDSTKFDERQRTEWYVNKILEGLSLFATSAPEKDDEMKDNLAHSCVNIGLAFYQLILMDYRVRLHIATCLQERSGGPCEKCAPAATSELALWYTLGFGFHSDTEKARTWLGRSGITEDQLHQRLDGLKRMAITALETTTHSESGSRGLFGVDIYRRYGSRNFEAATAHISQETHDLEQSLGGNHWIIFELKMELNMLLSEQGRYDEAQDLLEITKNSVKEKHGSDHPYHVRVDLVLAGYYKRKHLWEQAEHLLREAKSTLLKNLGLSHQLTIQASLELASIYAERKKSQEAKDEFERLHAAVEETLHPGHPLMRQFLQSYTTFLEKSGNIAEANLLRNQHAASKIFSVLVDDHNRGRTARLMGDLDTAERLLLKVKEDAEKLAERHRKPEESNLLTRTALVATQNLALVYRDRNDFKKAEMLQRTLKEDVKTKLGPLHPVFLDVTFDLARTLEMQQGWVEAEELQLVVKKGRATTLGPQHERTLFASKRLATIYDMQGRLEEAENEMEEVKEACMQRLGAENPESLEAIVALGTMYSLHGKLDRADKNLSVAVLTSQNVVGPHAEQTLGLMSNLGLVYLSQGRLQEAAELLKRTREDMFKHLGPGHEFTRRTETHLTRVYQEQTQRRIQEIFALPEHEQPLVQQDPQHMPLSEDEQMQIALLQSFQTQPDRGFSEDGHMEGDPGKTKTGTAGEESAIQDTPDPSSTSGDQILSGQCLHEKPPPELEPSSGNMSVRSQSSASDNSKHCQSERENDPQQIAVQRVAESVEVEGKMDHLGEGKPGTEREGDGACDAPQNTKHGEPAGGAVEGGNMDRPKLQRAKEVVQGSSEESRNTNDRTTSNQNMGRRSRFKRRWRKLIDKLFRRH